MVLQMKSKYYNVKTRSLDGTIFDSRKEAIRWDELTLLQRAGKISDLQRQVEFVLIPPQYETYERYGKNGQRLKDGTRLVERAAVYHADFVYKDENGDTVVEDTKSKATRTEAYVLRRKMMYYNYKIRIKEV